MSKTSQTQSIPLVSREVTDWPGDVQEDIAWIGKPWRRIERLVTRYFYKGEQVGENRDLTLHIGSRRLGRSVTLIFAKHDCLDYSEERQ